MYTHCGIEPKPYTASIRHIERVIIFKDNYYYYYKKSSFDKKMSKKIIKLRCKSEEN